MKHPIERLAITVSIITAIGIFVHDMKIDKFTLTAIALPVVIASLEGTSKLALFSSDAHTHVERASITQAVADLRSPNPRIQPRAQDDKKHLMQRYVARGDRFFDSYNLPLA